MTGAPVDLRDIPVVSLKRIREVTQNFQIMQVEDFNPAGDSEGHEYSWSIISPAVLFRDNYSCRVCGKASFERVKSEKEFNKIHFSLQVHHIIPRKENGKSNFRNLITLCEDCHHRTFRNGYSGVPINDNSTLYDFNEKVLVAVPPDFVRDSDATVRTVQIREIARAFDDNTAQFRVYRTEGSSLNFQFPMISRTEFMRVLKNLAEKGMAHDYVTLIGNSNRREVPVRVFTDQEGSLIFW